MKMKWRLGVPGWRRLLVDIILMLLALVLVAALARTLIIAPYVLVLGPGSLLDAEPANVMSETEPVLLFGFKLPFLLSQWGANADWASESLERNGLLIFHTQSTQDGGHAVSLGRLRARSGEVVSDGVPDSDERTMVQPGTVLIDPIGPESRFELPVERIEARILLALWRKGVLSQDWISEADSKTP